MNEQAFHPFRSEKARQQYLEFYDKLAQTWPVPSQTKMIETSYGQTFVRISGPDNAPPLVLLPGGGYNSLGWLYHIEALSANYRTYAIDNIYDYGRSIYSRPLTSPDVYVKWLAELFNKLGFDKKINLMGLSQGGWLTALYTVSFPQRINKTILIAPLCTVLPLSSKFFFACVYVYYPCHTSQEIFIAGFLEILSSKVILAGNTLKKYWRNIFWPEKVLRLNH
jgi:pimeloyl-ACP methyl ester carboxylesterase